MQHHRIVVIGALALSAFVLAVCLAPPPAPPTRAAWPIAATTVPAATALTPSAGLPPNCKLPGPHQDEIVAFIDAGCFRFMAHDPAIRSTGPIVIVGNRKLDLSTHNRVKIYYSDGIVKWLHAGRPASGIPDGEVMIKEMFPSDITQPGADEPLGYATMVRDSQGSWDGWFWSSYIILKGDPRVPTGYAGWSDCINCHSSADNPDATFAALEHLDGTLIEPQEYFTEVVPFTITNPLHTTLTPLELHLPQPLDQPNADFVKLFDQPLQPADPLALAFPSQLPNDHVTSKPPTPEHFLTSDACSGCHNARVSNITGPNMVFTDTTGQVRNLSPYGEWSASLMGLAGRDPVFHAQLASEKALRPAQTEYLDNTCYRCHGVMGLRQLQTDSPGTSFQHSMIYATGSDQNAQYGALARDGVSCTVCHHVSPEGLGTEATYTGQFNVGPSNEVYGQFADVKTYPMRNGLGITPVLGEHIKSAGLCGSCHSVILPRVPLTETTPILKDPTIEQGHEQATYLEWRNSAYQNEREPINHAEVKTCQSCHMPQTFDGQSLQFKIANIEDDHYPAVPNRAPDEEITLPERPPYSRHTLIGINQFTLQMFQQFSGLLGLSTVDPYGYNGSVLALLTAGDEGVKLAQKETATVKVQAVAQKDGNLEATVTITNHAGHKFPSGVNFRRAFIEFDVLDANGHVLWASGRTSNLGVIVDATGMPLDTEFSKVKWQPHYDVITQQNQVQIYEERNANQQNELTTSFLDLFYDVKDNRLLPKGWSLTMPHTDFMQPVGINDDPRYADGSGSDEITYRVPLSAVPNAASVRATLYYQPIPPYYLRDRFTIASGNETQRLYYLTSHLATQGGPLENWKLMIGVDQAALP
jgi:hypothetical protein